MCCDDVRAVQQPGSEFRSTHADSRDVWHSVDNCSLLRDEVGRSVTQRARDCRCQTIGVTAASYWRHSRWQGVLWRRRHVQGETCSHVLCVIRDINYLIIALMIMIFCSYTDVIPADRAFFDAGVMCKVWHVYYLCAMLFILRRKNIRCPGADVWCGRPRSW